MRTLNLVDLEKSDIKYKISQFPDGQQDIVLDTTFVDKFGIYGAVEIKSRFNSFRDLELIICANKALQRLGMKEIHLYIPYLLGARSDRHFQEGGNSYLVDIIAPIINAQNFDSVTVLDVHSTVAAACIKKLKNTTVCMKLSIPINDNSILLSPDNGAVNRTYHFAKVLGYYTDKDFITASKYRDIDGKITHTSVPMEYWQYEKEIVIIDDICDGGRTFIEIAKILKEEKKDIKISLIVTHGIFSAGLKELYEYFDMIVTTNSVIDVVKDTEFNSRNDKYLDKVRQINVF
jgi:ribose-phosphate pyrophosphokinase